MFRSTAHIYDLLYAGIGKDYEAESAALDELIQACLPGASSLLDVGCGTGGHLRYLSDRYNVVGVDIDEGMLAEARRHLPTATLIEGDMRNFELGRTFDAVVCLFSSIGYMADRDELRKAIRAMVDHLRPGGVLVVDGWVRPDKWRDSTSLHLDTASAEGMQIARISLTRREGNKTYLEMHHLIGSQAGIEYLIDHHALTLFETDEYRSAFGDAGMVGIEVVASPMSDRDRYVGTKAVAIT
ncbi:MAG TPA: methyltransferase domain-containing protein [Acidimicrobiales bacterium]|nr:methyltransferase domain-containing protein [Acidimicrobiales bacterium]